MFPYTAATALVEGKLGKGLKKILKKVVAKDAQAELAVADAKLGSIIKVRITVHQLIIIMVTTFLQSHSPVGCKDCVPFTEFLVYSDFFSDSNFHFISTVILEILEFKSDERFWMYM